MLSVLSCKQNRKITGERDSVLACILGIFRGGIRLFFLPGDFRLWRRIVRKRILSHCLLDLGARYVSVDLSRVQLFVTEYLAFFDEKQMKGRGCF